MGGKAGVSPGSQLAPSEDSSTCRRHRLKREDGIILKPRNAHWEVLWSEPSEDAQPLIYSAYTGNGQV